MVVDLGRRVSVQIHICNQNCFASDHSGLTGRWLCVEGLKRHYFKDSNMCWDMFMFFA